MNLLLIEMSQIPSYLIIAAINLIGAFFLVKFRLKTIETSVTDHGIKIEKIKTSLTENKDDFYRIREKDSRAVNEKFEHVDFKREQLKDNLTMQMHQIDKKVTEIHTIIVNQK